MRVILVCFDLSNLLDVKFPAFSEDDIIESEEIGFVAISDEFSNTVSKIKSTMSAIINLKMDRLEDRDKMTQVSPFRHVFRDI